MTLLRFLQLRLGLHNAIITSSHLAGCGKCVTRGFQACCKGCPLAVFWCVRPVADGTTGVCPGMAKCNQLRRHTRPVCILSRVSNLLEVSQRLLCQRQAALRIYGCCSQPAVMVMLRVQKYSMVDCMKPASHSAMGNSNGVQRETQHV